MIFYKGAIVIIDIEDYEKVRHHQANEYTC